MRSSTPILRSQAVPLTTRAQCVLLVHLLEISNLSLTR
uniref:Uncharacterized protein n=1 Tax=Rhizophora mucronata TaxID=61149 RepID=A0A2P2P398_RHIMU